MLIYHPEKKFGNKPGTKENVEKKIFNIYCIFATNSKHFAWVSFSREEDGHVSFRFLCLLDVHTEQQKKSKKWKKNDKIKLFALWNIFQKTISNLSKLT